MQRKNHDATFKAKVALEVVKGLRTVNEVASENGLHPNMLTRWKRQLLEGLPAVFSSSTNSQRKEKEYEQLIARLYQKIGQLEVELDWLKKKSSLLSK